MKQFIFPLTIGLISSSSGAFGQSVDYDDVVVVVNSNDSVSVALGNYFMAARSIPAVNLIAVDAPTIETVDATDFQSIRYQIKAYMMANNLVGPINYMVMMKGMPLRVGTTYCDSVPPLGCSSTDSELSLLFSPDSTLILSSAGAQNPFVQSTVPHSFASNNTLLVTRLDGYDANDVTLLIDRSGPLLPVVKQDALLVGDASHYVDQFTQGYFFSQFELCFTLLNSSGWNSIVDTTFNALSGLNNVLIYLSGDAAPMAGIPNMNWSNGSLAMAYSDATAASFDQSTNDPIALRCADLIADGATGVRGNVHISFASVQGNLNITLDRYLGSVGLNLAESYYAGIPALSLGDLIIGDPKTSLTISVGLGPDIQGSSTTLQAYPNPVSNVITVPMDRSKVLRCQLLSADGRVVAYPSLSDAGPLSLSVSELPSGTYLLQVHTTEGLRMARFSVVR